MLHVHPLMSGHETMQRWVLPGLYVKGFILEGEPAHLCPSLPSTWTPLPSPPPIYTHTHSLSSLSYFNPGDLLFNSNEATHAFQTAFWLHRGEYALSLLTVIFVTSMCLACVAFSGHNSDNIHFLSHGGREKTGRLL